MSPPPARRSDGITGVSGAHPVQRDGMAAAGAADGSHRCRINVELRGVGFRPADGVVYVGDLRRVGVVGGQPEIHGDDHYAAGGQGRVHVVVGGAVIEEPASAVGVDQAREGAFALRLVDCGLKAAALVFQVDDIYSFDVEPGRRVVFDAGHGCSLRWKCVIQAKPVHPSTGSG